MNDGSIDETARVARSYGATVVDVVDDTEGKWYGKSHACYQGVTHACTNRIAFVDADVTFLRKDAVETLINQYHYKVKRIVKRTALSYNKAFLRRVFSDI